VIAMRGGLQRLLRKTSDASRKSKPLLACNKRPCIATSSQNTYKPPTWFFSPKSDEALLSF
jgi:hypothetical protein